MNNQHNKTLTDRARALADGLLTRVGHALHRAGVHPNMVTLAGLIWVMLAALVLASGHLQIGGLLLLIGLPLDAVDGAVARARGTTDGFGALFDSALDRYADGVIFAGLGYHFADNNRPDMLLLVFAALIGSYMVSYVRARAEGLGVSIKIGLFTRLERLGVILLMLLVPGLLDIGLWVLALGTNLTGLQRLRVAYQHLNN